jgi:beta-1,4-mannosyltransferase
MRRTTFIIDWCDWGYSILKVNGRHWALLSIVKIFEKVYGSCAHLNFIISNAMVAHLKKDMNIDAMSVPERAIKNVFNRLTLSERNMTRQKIFSLRKKNLINHINKKEAPLLLLSSTSWTSDEDFELLLKAF